MLKLTKAGAVLWAMLGLLGLELFAQPSPRIPDLSPQAGEDSPQAILALLGVDASLLDNVQDGHLPDESEVEVFSRLLVAMRRFDRVKLRQYAQRTQGQLLQAAKNPDQFRGEVFRLQGKLQKVRRRKVIAEVARLTGRDHWWECRLELSEVGLSALVLVERVPRKWLSGQGIGHQVETLAVYVKQAGSAQQPLPVFVARRLRWYPPGLSAQLRLDAGVWDQVRARGPLTAADTEPFFELLAAVKHSSAQKLAPFLVVPQQEVDLGSPIREQVQESNLLWLQAVLNYPRRFQGKVLRVRGVVQRAVQVAVESPFSRELYGLDHYWELEVFLRTEVPVLVHGQQVSDYPVVICTPRLPPGFPQGEGVNEPVEAWGVFFKLWSYRSTLGLKQRPREFLQQADRDGDGRVNLEELAHVYGRSAQSPALREVFALADRNRNRFLELEELAWMLGRQSAPLLVAPQITWLRAVPARPQPWLIFGGALVVLAGLAVLVWTLYRVNRSDDELTRRVRKSLLDSSPPQLPPSAQESADSSPKRDHSREA